MSHRDRPRATILLVGTDPAVASWSQALEAERFGVIVTADVEQAVGHAREGGIDVVVFDGSDRPADGRLLVGELERLPEPPPLVLVSSSPRAPELSAHLGAAAFVPKPCAPADLVDECVHLASSRPLQFEDEPTGPRVNLDELA